MRMLFVIAILGVWGYTAILSQGAKVPSLSLPDQFGRLHRIGEVPDQRLLVAFDKKAALLCNSYLAKRSPDFLHRHHALFISCVDGVPQFLVRNFILPQLRRQKFPILLLYKNSNIFPKKEGALTYIQTLRGKVLRIRYLYDEEDLEKNLP